MTYEDINVGDVLYDKVDSKINPRYLLVVWKSDKCKEVGCRKGYKKADKTPGYKVDVGQNIIIGVNNIINFNFNDSEDPDSFGYAWYLRDKERADKWQKVAHLSESSMHLFWIIEKYSSNYSEFEEELDNVQPIIIDIINESENIKEAHGNLIELERVAKNANQKYLSARDKFVEEFYPDLKKNSNVSKSIEV